MSAPAYTPLPLSDFQTVQTSYPPQHETKTFFNAKVEERDSHSGNLDMATAPLSTFQRISLRIKTVSHKFWLFELAASLVSILIFGVIILVLWSQDHEIYDKANNPNSRPTLFPILAILGVIMRAAMLLPVATAIAQLKWGWFRVERRLVDLERFDGAASGILGSLRLLWSLRFRNVAVVGAALTILAIPLDAVIQSSVRLSQTTVVNDIEMPSFFQSTSNVTDRTTVSRATNYNSWQIIDDPDWPWPETSMMNAVRFGLGYDNGPSSWMLSRALDQCPTGFCTFNKSQTLAIGKQCIDRTADINTIRKEDFAPMQELTGSNATLEYHGATYGNTSYDGQYIGAASDTAWPTSWDGYSQQFDTDFGPLLLRTTMMMNFMTASDMTDEEMAASSIATECALFWYIKTTQERVNTTEYPGIISEDIPTPLYETSFDFLGQYNSEWFVLEPKQCFVDGKEIARDESDFYKNNCLFTVGQLGGLGLMNMFLDTSLGGQGFSGQTWVQNATSGTWLRSNDFNRQLLSAMQIRDKDDTMILGTKESTQATISRMWNNLAWAMTYTIRTSPSEQIDADGNISSKLLYTNGTIYRPVYIWSIDWPRLGAPAFVVGFSAFFVLFTAITTRKQHLWKRSALPFLFHGFGEREKACMGDVTSYVKMYDIAEKLHVKLEERAGPSGARFTAAQ